MSDKRWGRIPDGIRNSGLCRGKLYELAARHEGLFRKADAATIVDLQMLDEILADLPAADIGKREPAPVPVTTKPRSEWKGRPGRRRKADRTGVEAT
jgi:hypothetical protein